jgi:trk system potassium uptake protein
VLAEELSRSLILHGDATDLELLEMEAIGEADGFVAYTGSDETNLLSCLLAKNLGTRKVDLADRSLRLPPAGVARRRRRGRVAALAAVNAILSYVRRGSVLAVATLKGTDAEGIEFDVPESFRTPGSRWPRCGCRRAA